MLARKYTSEEIQFLKENYPSKGASFCAEHLKRPISSIHHKVSRLDIGFNVEKFYTTEDLEIIKRYYVEYGAKFCQKYVSLTYDQITGLANNILGLKRNRESINWNTLNTRTLNRDVLSINLDNILLNPKACYILGILWADGHINKKGHDISICLVEDDMKYIEHLFDEIGIWNVSLVNKTKEHHKQQIKRQIHDFRFASFLKDHSYTNKTIDSPCNIINKIPDENKKYFYRGYLDGDGNIYYSEKYKKGSLSFYSSYDQDWTFIKKLAENLNIELYQQLYVLPDKGRYSYMRTGSRKSIIALGEYIFDGFEEDKIGFERKFNILQKFKT